MENENIYINFFPLKKQVFEFTGFVKKCSVHSQKLEDFAFEVKKFKLPNGNAADREDYFVTFEKQPCFQQRTIKSIDNNWLTIWFIFKQLCYNVNINFIDASCINRFEKYIDVVVKETALGTENISITPKRLNSQFGVLIDFHFRKDENVAFSREVQKLSLSLDATGKPNRDYYSDKYNKIQSFINGNLFGCLNSLSGTEDIDISSEMLALKSTRLATKKYIFGNNNVDTALFQGIKNHGPFMPYSGNPILCFVYRNQDKPLSHKLYYALQGKTYSTFDGMDKIFKFPMNKNTIMGIPVSNYTESEIAVLINNIKANAFGRLVIPIVLVPWTKESANEEESRLYYITKHHFLENNIPSQFVGIPRVEDYEVLKWSVSNIGLQIFTKLGGSPWCLKSKTKSCLIIGVGQSHKVDYNKNIEKYYSYSIMTDSSGLFKNIKVLSENANEAEYLNGLSAKLNELIESEINNYDNFVIHTSFRLRDKELSRINGVLDVLSSNLQKNFVVIRFSDFHHYIGFNLVANSRTLFESTILSLNKKEYLVWFEGLSSVTKTVKGRVGPPMHLTIDFAKSCQHTDIHAYLQDGINLSGANWRGFNTKTMPVSILYARLLSSFLAAFDRYNLERINIEQLTPWFL
jgi:hypothetical protein